MLPQEKPGNKEKQASSTPHLQTETYDTNMTMSAIAEAEEALRNKSRNESVLTTSENLFGEEEKEAEFSESVPNDIENAAVAADLDGIMSSELSSPRVLKLLTSIMDGVNSLIGKVERISNKVDKLERNQELVIRDVEVMQQWRTQLSNEVTVIRKVVESEHERLDKNMII